MDYQTVRFSVFFLILILLITFESLLPWQKRKLKRIERWPGNVGLIIFSSFCLKLLFPTGLIFFSKIALENDFGLIHFFKLENTALTIGLSLIALDFFIYLQHIITHKISFLWRFHQIHHSDKDLDFTSALRFHPIEMVGSFIYKALLIVIFGLSVDSILLFEIVLNSFAMFNHSNIFLGPKLEKVLKYIFVTPQMHLVHHSVKSEELNTNFGFSLSVWDRLFRTYNPTKYVREVGLANVNLEDSKSLRSLLVAPFRCF